MAGSFWRTASSGLIPLLIATSLLVMNIGITAVFVSQQDQTAAELPKAISANNELQKVLSGLQDAETGQRGFLLTDRPAYLAPFAAAKDALSADLERLETIYADRPADLETLSQLKELSNAKIEELSRTIELRQAGDRQGALDLVKTDKGLHLMDDARATIARLRDSAYQLSVARQAAAERAGRHVEAAVFASVLIALALTGFVLTNARSRERRLATALGDLRVAHGDLTAASAHREKLETQLRQSQKMEALGQLTGGLAHDFNNMLAVIIGNFQLIKRQPSGDIARFVDNGLEGAERGRVLIYRLLAFARQQPLNPELLPLNKLVPSLSEMLRRTLGETIRLEVVLAGGLWLTKADANQLESTIVNLAVNGRDAMPNGGRLTIETANAYLDEAYAAENLGVPPGQYVMVAVSDSGIGMVPDVASRAFDPFFTTKDVGRGTGLGLSQVYGFVKQSNGHIKIYTELGEGTTVKIYLPRSVVAPATAAPASPVSVTRDADVPLGKPDELILVVEDEDRVRRATVDTLRHLQYSVIHADGGEGALRLLDDHPGVTLLFTDVVMPGMTGKQLADVVRTKRPEIKVLFTTGYTRNAIVHNGVVDADVELIGKPFTLPQLAKRVREVMNA